MGDEEVVIGFRFVGVPGSVVRTEEEAREAFANVTEEGSARVLILTEQVAALIPEQVMDWQMNGSYPLIVEVPGIEGHAQNRRSLIDSIRDAVGIHV
ncbi:MAG TPA: V-type ATP synthase subunit F [Spirochaetia bacterium]|nr:V-type ATP synthase subunit F [Spirochaetia bacterium]